MARKQSFLKGFYSESPRSPKNLCDEYEKSSAPIHKHEALDDSTYTLYTADAVQTASTSYMHVDECACSWSPCSLNHMPLISERKDVEY